MRPAHVLARSRAGRAASSRRACAQAIDATFDLLDQLCFQPNRNLFSENFFNSAKVSSPTAPPGLACEVRRSDVVAVTGAGQFRWAMGVVLSRAFLAESIPGLPPSPGALPV